MRLGRKHNHALAVGFFVSVLLCAEGFSFQVIEEKLLPSDGSSGDVFGSSVSVSGDYALLGAFGDLSISGSAYVFKRDGDHWVEETKLIPSDHAIGDMFGYSVSIDGGHAIVGAPGNNSDLGAAYVFELTGGVWTEKAKLVGTNLAPDACFGFSVSIDGDYLIIGAVDDDDNGPESGSAYIFKREGDTWTQQAKLVASHGTSSDQFGTSVAISGEYAIVGAPEYNVVLANEGAAYLFKREDSLWVEQTILTEREPVWEGRFGLTVAASNDQAVIGTLASGQAYVYVKDSSAWREADRLRPQGIGIGFGQSVDIEGDYVIVGAEFDDSGGSDAGSIYLFRKFGSFWLEETKILASDGAPNDYFGSAVAISSGSLVIGSPSDDDNGSGSGSAYAYTGIFATEPISARITSSNSKVVIPPEGGTFDYTMHFVNNTVLPQNTDIWVVTERPGPPPIVTFGPRNKTFGSSVSVSKNRSQGVPGNAAAGEYKLILYVGTYPDSITDRDTLTFTKLAAEHPEEAIDGNSGLVLEADNYPNPFNPSTTIRFSLPKATKISLKIFNTLGQEVRTLVSGELGEGVHQVEWNASENASGIYFYILQTQDFGVLTRKILLIK